MKDSISNMADQFCIVRALIGQPEVGVSSVLVHTYTCTLVRNRQLGFGGWYRDREVMIRLRVERAVRALSYPFMGTTHGCSIVLFA